MNWLVDKWAKVRLAHEAIMMDDAKKVLQANRKAVSDSEESDEMQIGDNHFYHQPPRQGSRMATAALVASSLLGAGGIGAAIATYFASRPATPPANNVDTDTQYQFRIVEDD